MFALNTAAKPLSPSDPPKPKLITPALGFSNEAQTTIDVTITGGTPYGAPYGFSLQWMTLDDYLAHGFSSELPFGCEASFAGEPPGSGYKLAAGQSVTVTVGDFTDDTGFSTICQTPLLCGTTYVFRVFAHGGKDYSLSDKTDPPVQASTLACSTGTCTLTQGYWKNHPEAWPLDTLSLGTTSYSKAQLLVILHEPVGGNGLISLAHQLIAAKLSVAAGSDPTPLGGAIAAADGLIGGLIVPQLEPPTPIVTGDSLDPNYTSFLVGVLDDWLTSHDCGSDSTDS